MLKMDGSHTSQEVALQDRFVSACPMDSKSYLPIWETSPGVRLEGYVWPLNIPPTVKKLAILESYFPMIHKNPSLSGNFWISARKGPGVTASLIKA
jgi:hypothetical protein